MGKKTAELTELQRQAIECLEGSRTSGMAQSAYAVSKGWNARAIYDALAQLRRTGRVPTAARTAKAKLLASYPVPQPLPFARVRVRAADRAVAQATAALPVRLRMVLRSGRPVEIDVPDAEHLPRLLAALERAG
jgi:hypothetical protein